MRAVEHPVPAVEQRRHRRDGAEDRHARHEQRHQLERPRVRRAHVVVQRRRRSPRCGPRGGTPAPPGSRRATRRTARSARSWPPGSAGTPRTTGLRNHRDSSHSGRNVASVTSASGRSSTSRMTADRDHRQQRGDQPVQAGVEQLVERVHVGRQPGHHPAGGVPLVEGQRQPLHVVEDPPAQVEQHAPGRSARSGSGTSSAARRPPRRRTAARRSPPAAASSRRRPAPGCRGRCRRRPATGRPSPPCSAAAPGPATTHSAALVRAQQQARAAGGCGRAAGCRPAPAARRRPPRRPRASPEWTARS